MLHNHQMEWLKTINSPKLLPVELVGSSRTDLRGAK